MGKMAKPPLREVQPQAVDEETPLLNDGGENVNGGEVIREREDGEEIEETVIPEEMSNKKLIITLGSIYGTSPSHPLPSSPLTPLPTQPHQPSPFSQPTLTPPIPTN